MNRWVEISFDCLPLRSVGRLDIPIDASPKYRQRCQRIKDALEKHGSHNTYYLYNALCTYHLVNHEEDGLIRLRFEGTVLTDAEDRVTKSADLEVELASETDASIAIFRLGFAGLTRNNTVAIWTRH